MAGMAAFVAYALVVGAPADNQGAEEGAPLSFGRQMRNPSLWLVVTVWVTFTFSTMALSGWAPTFQVRALGIDEATASFDTSLMWLAGIPTNIFAGWLLGWRRLRYILLPISFAVTALLLFWSFRLEGGGVVAAYMLAVGVASNPIPTAVFTYAQETVTRVQYVALAMALVTIGGNIGSLTGPPSLAAVVGNGFWARGATMLAMVAALGTALSLVVARKLSTQ
jgi:predicted MFS family arabinose efflux permease